MDNDLIYVNVLSNDHERLIKFYNKIVGFKPLNPDANPTTEHWYGFDTGHTQFAIEPLSNRDTYNFKYNKENPVLIQFKVNTIGELIKWTERLEKGGVAIGQRILKKSYGIITTFADPDGNVIELLYREEIKKLN